MAINGSFIDTKQSAVQFVKRAGGPILGPDVRWQTETAHPRVRIEAFRDRPGEKEALCRLAVDFAPDQLFVTDLEVRKALRGKGLGSRLVAGAILMAAQRGLSVITPVNVFREGVRFWPALGGVPLSLSDLPRKLAHLADAGEGLSPSARAKLTRLSVRAARKPVPVWRRFVLSQPKEPALQAAAQEVLNETCFPGYYRLFLFEPSTRRMMENRLGALPSFARPASLDLTPPPFCHLC